MSPENTGTASRSSGRPFAAKRVFDWVRLLEADAHAQKRGMLYLEHQLELHERIVAFLDQCPGPGLQAPMSANIN